MFTFFVIVSYNPMFMKLRLLWFFMEFWMAVRDDILKISLQIVKFLQDLLKQRNHYSC